MNSTKVEARQLPDPDLLRKGDWESYWRGLLASLGTSKIVAVDLDDTVWLDILVHLNEAFGPIDTQSGDKRWKLYDAAFKRNGATIDGVFRTMTNGEHLVAEYRDLFQVKKLDELIAWCKTNITLMPGFKEFVDFLAKHDIKVVAISNGAREIAEPLLAHHGLDLPLISNWFEGENLTFVHGDDVGVDKGRLVRLAADWGYEVVACAGDSKGDVSLAEATADLGGLVLARGSEGGLAAWCEKHVAGNQWVLVDNYQNVHHIIQQRIGGR